MNDAVYAALVILAVTVLGALTTLVKAKVDHLVSELQNNTTITTQARDASNGRLRETLDQLAAAQDQAAALRRLVRDREDRIAYLVARIPDAEELMQGYHERRTI